MSETGESEISVFESALELALPEEAGETPAVPVRSSPLPFWRCQFF